MRKITVGALTASAFALAAAAANAQNTGTSVATAAPAATSTISIGSGTAKFGGLLQAWTIATPNRDESKSAFRLRRAELKFSGTVGDRARWFVMVDPAKTLRTGNVATADTKILQDLGVGFEITKGVEVTAGQFKTPTTAEGLDSSADLLLPERSVSGRTFGDRRELGVRVAYKEKLFNVATMVSSGQSITVDDTTRIKDLNTRVELTPTKEIGIGAFSTLGEFTYTKRSRWGMNARYGIDNAIVRAEYAHGKDAAVHSDGFTTEVAYSLTDELQPVARYEIMSPNQAFGVPGKVETVGMNYYFAKPGAKLQVAGSAMQNMSANSGSPTISKGSNNKEVTVAFQAAI